MLQELKKNRLLIRYFFEIALVKFKGSQLYMPSIVTDRCRLLVTEYLSNRYDIYDIISTVIGELSELITVCFKKQAID